jgi:hypothetical protein
MFAFVNAGGVATLLLFALAITALLMVSVFFFLVAAVKSMFLVYLAILPVNREPLWRSISDSIMGLISLIVMTCLLALPQADYLDHDGKWRDPAQLPHVPAVDPADHHGGADLAGTTRDAQGRPDGGGPLSRLGLE